MSPKTGTTGDENFRRGQNSSCGKIVAAARWGKERLLQTAVVARLRGGDSPGRGLPAWAAEVGANQIVKAA